MYAAALPGGAEHPTDRRFQPLMGIRDQRLLRALASFEKRREVTALPQLRDAQLQRAEAGVERAVAVAVAPGAPLAAALITPGADQSLDVGLHQQLQYRLRHGSQKISVASLLQQLGQHQSLFGHRVLSRFRLKSCNSTLAELARWPPQPHRSPTLRINPKIPPQAWTLTFWERLQRYRLRSSESLEPRFERILVLVTTELPRGFNV